MRLELAGQSAAPPERFSVRPGRRIPPESAAFNAALGRIDYQIKCALDPQEIAKPTSDELLLEFLALSEAEDSDLAAFAMRHGVLGVCPVHGMPVGHRRAVVTLGDWDGYNLTARPSIPSSEPCLDPWFTGVWKFLKGTQGDAWDRWEARYNLDNSDPTEPDSMPPMDRWEAVASWRSWIRRFQMMFESVQAFKLGQQADCGSLDMPFLLGYTNEPSARQNRTPRTSAADPNRVGRVLSSWLLDAKVTPNLYAIGNRFDIGIAGEPRAVFAGLTLQLLLFASGARDAYPCDGCGGYCTGRKRRPKKGQNRYCKKCGARASNRDAMRRARSRPRGTTNG